VSAHGRLKVLETDGIQKTTIVSETRLVKTVAATTTPEDARRLVACWNACEKFSTEALEDEAPAKLLQDRDQLLERRQKQYLMFSAARAARQTARLVTDQNGHELIAVEPQLWASLQEAIKAIGPAS
jgi:hypothetical protein